jgi:putative oxidoreductase
MSEKENLDRRKRGKHPALMKSLNRFADPVYCIMRLIVGLMLACHGAQKVLGWFARPGQPPEPPDMLMTIGGWIEVICGLLIAIGLLTRPAVFLASGMMAVAYFMAHASGGFFPIVNRGELAVVYSWLFFFMFFYGPGRLSIDAMIRGSSAPANSKTDPTLP